MNKEVSPIRTDADVERARVLAISDKLIEDAVVTKPSEEKFEICSSDAYNMATFDPNKIKGLIVEETYCINAEHTQAEVRKRILETLVDMHQLGNSAPFNGIKTAYYRILKTTVTKVLNRGTGDDVMLVCLKQWSKSDTYMNAIVE